MKVLTSKKAMIALLSLGTVVLAGTIKDINSRSISKKHEILEMSPAERNLASDDDSPQRIARMKIPMSDAYKIDGEWEITRIVGSDEVVKFDKLNNPEDKKKTLKTPMKLISISGVTKIKINNDAELIYDISLFSSFGTIAIFKQMGNGFEILEARKIRTKKENVVVAGETQLVLERALNQAKSSKILTGADVSGEMILTKSSIEGLSVSITNTNGEVQSIEIASAQLLDGGSFKADVGDEEVSGVVFNNGKDGYRLSFVTGPLAGAMLNFVTQDELERIEAKSNDNGNNEENYFASEDDAVKAQTEALEERKDVATQPAESIEPIRVLSADEIKETAETQGFSF